jgi:23S rRNA (pseudouridine1915-N3)-methyltransferase
MKIALWMIGKTNQKYLKEGMQEYEKRLKRYLPFSTEVIPDVKKAGKMSAEQLKRQEGQLILDRLKTDDLLILLDEKGKQYTSEEFAREMEKLLRQPHRRLIFQIGGAYGFSEEVYQRAQKKLALSKMTFSHQMIRLFFLEQLYRAMTILKNEPYHNS